MKTRIRRFSGSILCLAPIIALPVQADVSATARPAAVRNRVLELVNSARTSGRRCGSDYFGAADPLRWSERLADAAAAHARDMAVRRYFDHQAPEGSQPRDRIRRTGYSWRLVGENIAFGPETVEEVVAGWLASPGHCANLMDPRFRDMGVSVALGRRRGHLYWVQDLGAPKFGQPAR